MSRGKLASAISVVLTAIMMSSACADDQGSAADAAPPLLIPPQLADQPAPVGPALVPDSEPATGLNPAPYQPAAVPARLVSNQPTPFVAPTPLEANIVQSQPNVAAGYAPQQQGYVRLNAPMYPTPRPNIPIWTGSTVITNQAFAPQEMLYPHTYRAIYPPFYHRVRGGWFVTPFGVRSHEQWQLQGTQVEVKYRSSYPGPFSGAYWHPPATLYNSDHWR